mgnify:CR=1 FL=1
MMKLSSYLKNILPSPAVFASFFVLPLILTIYFTVTQYSDRFIVEQDISYFDVQNNWLGQVFLDQKWIDWFNRFMDFAFWGMAALIVIIAIWAITSAKISFKNHYAQEDFNNFHVSKSSWHGHFFIVFLLKCSLVVIVIYSMLSVIGKVVPQLSVAIALALQEFTWQTVYPVLLSCIALVAYQFLFTSSIKIFKHLRAA